MIEGDSCASPTGVKLHRASSRLMNPFTLDFEDIGGVKIANQEEESKEVELTFEDFGKNAGVLEEAESDNCPSLESDDLLECVKSTKNL